MDAIEQMTGLDFFPNLPAQASLEASIDVFAWDWSKSQKARPQAKQEVTQPVVQPPANRREYRPDGNVSAGQRPVAPVCADWPDTGYWLSTNSQKRHNPKCENYRKTRGYPCTKDEGQPCGKCGG